MRIKNKKAFTIIELIVVIAVIGILVLLAMPRFLGYVERSKIAVIRHDIKVTEGKMTEMLMHGDDEFINSGGLISDWEKGYVEEQDLIDLIKDGKLFQTRGIVPIPDPDNLDPGEEEVDLAAFKIVPKSIRTNVGTKLKGTFYANAKGKVYYSADRVNGNDDILPEIVCRDKWVEVDNDVQLSYVLSMLEYDETEFDMISYEYNGKIYLYAFRKADSTQAIGFDVNMFLTIYDGNMANIESAFLGSLIYAIEMDVDTVPPFICKDTNGDEDITFLKPFVDTRHLSSTAQTSDGFVTVGYNSHNEVNGAIIIKTDKYGNTEWLKNFDGNGENNFLSVIESSDGGFVAVGYTKSTDFEGFKGERDAIMFKFDSQGNVEWRNNFGGTSSDIFNKVIESSEGYYIAVGSSSSNDGNIHGDDYRGLTDAVMAIVNPNGSLSVFRTYGGSKQDGFDSIIEVEDGFVMVGYTNSSDYWLNPDHKGDMDALIVKTDKHGSQKSFKSYGGSGNDYFNEVVSLDNDGLMLVGSTMSNDGDMEGKHKDNGIYGTLSVDAFVMELDSEGNIVWNKNYGGASYDWFTSLVKSSDGNYVALGTSNSSEANGDFGYLYPRYNDIIMMKFNPVGDIIWVETYGGDADDNSNSIINTSDGGYAVTGFTYSFNGDMSEHPQFNTSGFIIKTNEIGKVIRY